MVHEIIFSVLFVHECCPRKLERLIQLNGLAGTVKVAPRSQLLPLRPAADPCIQDVLEVCVDSLFRYFKSIFSEKRKKEKKKLKEEKKKKEKGRKSNKNR